MAGNLLIGLCFKTKVVETVTCKNRLNLWKKSSTWYKDSWSLKLLARTGWEGISLVSFFHWCLLEEIVAVVGKGTELSEVVFLQFCSLKCSSYSAFTLTPNKFYTRFILNVKFSAWGVIFAQLPIFNFLH